jgi:hypothetical protein
MDISRRTSSISAGIAPANETVVNPGTNATVTLEAVSLALGANMKMIKICLPGLPCTGSTAHYITVEARVNDQASSSQYDNAIPGNGIIIHDVLLNRAAISGTCFFNNPVGLGSAGRLHTGRLRFGELQQRRTHLPKLRVV